MLSLLEKRARGEKGISNSRSLVQVVRVSKLPFFFHDPHSDFVQKRKKIRHFGPITQAIVVVHSYETRWRGGGEKAKKGIAPKLNCKHRFYAG